jgi:hypothetical protein
MDLYSHRFQLCFKFSSLIPPKSNSADLMNHQEWFKSWLTIKYTVPEVLSDLTKPFKTFGTIPAL